MWANSMLPLEWVIADSSASQPMATTLLLFFWTGARGGAGQGGKAGERRAAAALCARLRARPTAFGPAGRRGGGARRGTRRVATH
jgi:hypothetical protein